MRRDITVITITVLIIAAVLYAIFHLTTVPCHDVTLCN